MCFDCLGFNRFSVFSPCNLSLYTLRYFALFTNGMFRPFSVRCPTAFLRPQNIKQFITCTSIINYFCKCVSHLLSKTSLIKVINLNEKRNRTLFSGKGICVGEAMYSDLENILQGLSTTFPLSFSVACSLKCCSL